MSEDRIEFLASGSASGEKPADHERLEMIRAILGDEAIWSEPPPEVGDAVIEAISGEVGPIQPIRRSSGRSWPWAAAVAAAAAVAMVLGLTGVFSGEPGEIVVTFAPS